jgi:hypothetical protein
LRPTPPAFIDSSWKPAPLPRSRISDRAFRGEYVSPAAPLLIHVGLGDVDAIREALKACVADVTPLLTIKVTSGQFLPAFRSDPEIARLMDALQGGPWPSTAP